MIIFVSGFLAGYVERDPARGHGRLRRPCVYAYRARATRARLAERDHRAASRRTLSGPRCCPDRSLFQPRAGGAATTRGRNPLALHFALRFYRTPR